MRHAGSWAACALLGALVALALIPEPYWIIAPGNAVDLRSHVHVEGYAASPDRYFLTDVEVRRASLLTSLARFLPGVKLVREDAFVPKDIEPAIYDRLLVQEMGESQDVAAFVAERAAGLRPPQPPVHIYVAEILSDSKAAGVLRAGDMLLSVQGRAVAAPGDVAGSIRRLAPGTSVPISLRRAGKLENVRVRTVRAPGSGSRLGILLRAHPERIALPVPVRYSLEEISGSSGGLMLALQVYGTLHPDRRRAGRVVAGTGTLTYDGTVGPIEGAEQKVIAAKRAGVRVFLVPKQNYREAAAQRGIRVIAVGSFDEALAVLKR